MQTLRAFDIKKIDLGNYYFIAHLLDRVLVGSTQHQDCHGELLEAIRQRTVLELHLFNEQKEIFAVRRQDELVSYKPLEHETEPEDKVITRSYELEEKFKKITGYDTLEVKEYIDYEDHLAYVKKTVLCKLKKAGE